MMSPDPGLKEYEGEHQTQGGGAVITWTSAHNNAISLLLLMLR
jgi:hypothetical protein